MDQERTLLIVAVGVAVAVGCFVLWGPSTFRSKRKKGHVVGLLNLGHTCFLNTLLQALASCPNVMDWLMQHKDNKDGSLVSALQKVLHVLNGEHDSEICDPYAPTEVISALVRHNWVISPGEQDAHELIHVILETLEDEMTSSSAKNGSLSDILLPETGAQGDDVKGPCIVSKSVQNGDVKCDGDQHLSSPISRYRPIRRIRMQENDITSSLPQSVDNLPIQTQQNPSPFRGTLTSQLKCTECGFKSALRFDKFDTLSLPLPTPAKRQHTLQTLLNNFVSTEIVKDVSCSNCSKEQEKPVLTTAMKTLNFGKLPKCLCFHIVRTTWNADGSPWKREDFVDFPEFLIMDNYTHSQVQRNARKKMKNLENGDNFKEILRETEVNGNISSTTSQKQAESPSPSNAKHMYRLKAVVVHTGDINSGHFITYRKGPIKSLIRHRWFYTSDMLVRRATLCDALLSNAYMLFYEKHVIPVI
ncbi:ubiquitin carboxyl-terminal hydrolase 30 homolog isoform X2 [Frankliniella occidentalis]|uniref:ubiquitinyl hydrolase 1 n=1 Tax=Frankliniella occidentalis TaxID=133901 RepID=A0A6J1RUK3_FRAOC|nr:ubiquitin carboxyl-terminal hydrolase 30 homolog isoform X2 [Frankliniella occidentalis]